MNTSVNSNSYTYRVGEWSRVYRYKGADYNSCRNQESMGFKKTKRIESWSGYLNTDFSNFLSETSSNVNLHKVVERDSYENQLSVVYNTPTKDETWLDYVLDSASVEIHLSVIDNIRNQCNFTQKHQVSVVKKELSRSLNSDSILPLLDNNPIDAYQAEDDVILIEWSFRNFGLGFCLAPDSADSGWYVTSNETAGNLFRSGLMTSDSEIKSATIEMVSLLQKHIGELRI